MLHTKNNNNDNNIQELNEKHFFFTSVSYLAVTFDIAVYKMSSK